MKWLDRWFARKQLMKFPPMPSHKEFLETSQIVSVEDFPTKENNGTCPVCGDVVIFLRLGWREEEKSCLVAYCSCGKYRVRTALKDDPSVGKPGWPDPEFEW